MRGADLSGASGKLRKLADGPGGRLAMRSLGASALSRPEERRMGREPAFETVSANAAVWATGAAFRRTFRLPGLARDGMRHASPDVRLASL